VVGYHGAGFANTMLSTHGACVLEISTNTDTAGEKLWRTNAFMCLPWNPSLRWAVYRVPLPQMLDANSIKYAPRPSLLPALTTRYSQLATHYLRYSLLTTHYLLLVLTAYYLLDNGSTKCVPDRATAQLTPGQG
jgi:hypothetical protein